MQRASLRQHKVTSGVQWSGTVSTYPLDLVAVAVITAAFMALAELRTTFRETLSWLPWYSADLLGGEIKLVAQSLVNEGRFSGPFPGTDSPTAWVAPVLPNLLAGLFLVLGRDSSVVADVVMAAQAAAAGFAGLFVAGVARRLGLATWGYLVFAALLFFEFGPLFMKSHDQGFLLVLVMLLWCGAVHFITNRHVSGKSIAGWGSLGGICALSSPAVGGAWAAVTVAAAVLSMRARRANDERGSGQFGLRAACVSMFIAIAITAPWTVRNYIVFGTIIPVKSNLGYELWQSQVADDNGVLSLSALQDHPYLDDGAQRRRYVEIGEQAFIKEKAIEGAQDIVSNPWEYIRRVGRRVSAEVLCLRDFSDELPPHFVAYQRIVGCLPLVAVVVLVTKRKLRLSPELYVAVLIWAVLMAPYFLVSYMPRYAVPTIGLKMIVCLHAIACIMPGRGEKQPLKSDVIYPPSTTRNA